MKSQKNSIRIRQTQPELTVVIPAYCEEKRIGKTLDKLAIFLEHDEYFKSKIVEVLVVAADSPDNTKEIVKAKQDVFKYLELLQPGHRAGKGRDVQYGMLRARGKIVVFMDADLAAPLSHLEKFYKTCLEGNDLVVGTRDLLHYTSNPFKCIFSKLGNIAYQFTGGVRIEDTQCGFKMFSERAGRLCFSKLTIMGWGFDMEVLAIARTNRLKVKTYRIVDWKDMPYSTHNEGALKIAWRSVRDHCYIVYKRLRGTYIDDAFE